MRRRRDYIETLWLKKGTAIKVRAGSDPSTQGEEGEGQRDNSLATSHTVQAARPPWEGRKPPAHPGCPTKLYFLLGREHGDKRDRLLLVHIWGT